MTIFCDHTYKLNCVLLWEITKNLFFNTQKLDHDGNKMWAPRPIPWDNTFQLVNGWQLAKMKKSIPDMSLP